MLEAERKLREEVFWLTLMLLVRPTLNLLPPLLDIPLSVGPLLPPEPYFHPEREFKLDIREFVYSLAQTKLSAR